MSMKNIDHVVVLMLENRAFDSMLGWLYEKDEATLHVGADDPYRGLQNVKLADFLNTAAGYLESPPVRGAVGFAVPGLAPGEEIAHVDMQFFKTKTPDPEAKATMKGVLQDFVDVMVAGGRSEAEIKAQAGEIMQTYTPAQLPVLSQLARHYAVSDDWFASVPSQTNPNRAFLMTGTSHGLVDNGQLETSPQAREIEKILHMGIGDDRFPEQTIFNALQAGGTDWGVFWQTSLIPHKIARLLEDLPTLIVLLVLDPVLAALLEGVLAALHEYTHYLEELASGELSSCYTWRLFPAIQTIPGADKHFQGIGDFHARARAGTLPAFSYIEPVWTVAQKATDDKWKNLFTHLGNDYHPPGNMIAAETFVKEVYESLIARPEKWERTLLVITFDEFVGTFDHVSPPAAEPPWGAAKPDFPTHGFDFKRFGGRVPAILVSPWIQRGTVFRSSTGTPYDHTSVIATTLKWRGLGDQIASFGARTRSAPTFEDVLTLRQPRTDAAKIGFLEVARKTGDPVQFGDPIVLRNQNGKYLTIATRAKKSELVPPVPVPDHLMGYAVDLDVAAHFPTLGGDKKATLTLRTSLPDPPAAVPDGATLFLVTLEKDVGSANFLGAWADSHDCYYYDNYVQGEDRDKETWIVQQVENSGQPLRYGDKIYLSNRHYADQRLSHDDRPFQGGWITTRRNGDSWVIEPAFVASGAA